MIRRFVPLSLVLLATPTWSDVPVYAPTCGEFALLRLQAAEAATAGRAPFPEIGALVILSEIQIRPPLSDSRPT